MDLFIYSDESGVFDYKHEDYYVFGGLICFGKEEKDILTRKYRHVEEVIRQNSTFGKYEELKACKLSNKQKYNVYRSLKSVFKFAVLIKQKKINEKIFDNKKHKQRYLDFAYKLVLKKALDCLFRNKVLKKEQIDNINIYCDEHTTATDGKYELTSALLNEFKYGTFNMDYKLFYEPILPHMNALNLNYCNSAKTTLVRAADIIANHIYFEARKNNGNLVFEDNVFILEEPSNRIVRNGLDIFKDKKQTI